MSSQIYFSVDDPMGENSTNTLLYNHFNNIKNREYRQVSWGSNKDIADAKIFPRGKAYWKVVENQIISKFNFL